jgi:hypothetical protein
MAAQQCWQNQIFIQLGSMASVCGSYQGTKASPIASLPSRTVDRLTFLW